LAAWEAVIGRGGCGRVESPEEVRGNHEQPHWGQAESREKVAIAVAAFDAIVPKLLAVSRHGT
jgi:hypothetical protein